MFIHRPNCYDCATKRVCFHPEPRPKGKTTVLNSVSAGILVKMLKKEKKRAQDAAAQLANITNGQSLVSRNASTLSANPVLKEGSKDTTSTDQGGRATQYMKRGTLLYIHKNVYCLQ